MMRVVVAVMTMKVVVAQLMATMAPMKVVVAQLMAVSRGAAGALPPTIWRAPR